MKKLTLLMVLAAVMLAHGQIPKKKPSGGPPPDSKGSGVPKLVAV